VTPVSDAEIARAAAIIRRGGLVAFPTETVYGLGANALDSAAVDRIYEAKGRPPTSPLIVHVGSVDLARQLCTHWSSAAQRLARRFWPGPLTLVLPKHPSIPDRVTAGLPTVGLRMPSHPVALALIRAAGVPIAAPSANRFTSISPTTAEHVRRSLGDRVDMILDGGATDVGIESTVLSLVESPALLRPGMITREQIEEVVGPVAIAGTVEGAHPSPGMHERHYSPRTRLVLLPQHGFSMCGHSARKAGHAVPMPTSPDAYAAELYSVLHELDEEGWETIYVETPPDEPEWAGIHDRLRRAASK
jgi:L-threonylcarbamoyladenylate synthase